MVKIGTVFSPIGKKALLCGSGELGKEIAIELQRYGVEVGRIGPLSRCSGHASRTPLIRSVDAGR